MLTNASVVPLLLQSTLLAQGQDALQHCSWWVQKLPSFLQALVELLLAAGIYTPEQAPQHVLINSYGQGAGISPHMDGPLYSPCVATITLGGPALMSFHEVKPDGVQGQLAAQVQSSIFIPQDACSEISSTDGNAVNKPRYYSSAHNCFMQLRLQ